VTRLKKLLDQCSLHTHRPAFSTGPSSTDQTQSRPVSLHASTTPSPPSSDQSMMHADEDDADERPAVAPYRGSRRGRRRRRRSFQLRTRRRRRRRGSCMLLLAGDGVPQREGSRLLALGLACIARLGRQPVEEDERGRAGRRARGNRGARS
jgi:hypothetical protein